MEKEKEGFPITSLREINTLLKAQHPNIVTVRVSIIGRNKWFLNAWKFLSIIIILERDVGGIGRFCKIY